MHRLRILFEPWSLGDALIAASVVAELQESALLACDPRWHTLIQLALPDMEPDRLLPVELDYTLRNKTGPASSVNSAPDPLRLPPSEAEREVLSIRGDFRDYRAARRLFPRSKIRMVGWLPFLARRVACVDWVYARQFAPVVNRYRAWCQLAGVPFEQLERAYAERRKRLAPDAGRIVLHIGAQWKSKQYPQTAQLARLLVARSKTVDILAGPRDLLPPEISEAQITRATGRELIERLQSAQRVIANDSGPLHLAALLGCRTLAIARTSNIREWIPPQTEYIASPSMPTGYRPDRAYCSDEPVEDWPTPDEIVARVLAT